MRVLGWRYAQNTHIVFKAETIPSKHNFWLFWVKQLQCVKVKYFQYSYLFEMSMMGWKYAQNTQILFRAKTIPGKRNFRSFLAITIAVCQIQMI